MITTKIMTKIKPRHLNCKDDKSKDAMEYLSGKDY
jgi:hypothetical protein